MENLTKILEGQNHPVFNHHCSCCNYLGSTLVYGEVYDCYLCEENNPTYVGRYSSEGSDYISLPVYLTDSLGDFEPYKTIIGLQNRKLQMQ